MIFTRKRTRTPELKTMYSRKEMIMIMSACIMGVRTVDERNIAGVADIGESIDIAERLFDNIQEKYKPKHGATGG